MYNFQIETSFVNLNPLARNPGSEPASTIYFILFTWASPNGTHMEPGCTAHMGPIWVPTWAYGSHIDCKLGPHMDGAYVPHICRPRCAHGHLLPEMNKCSLSVFPGSLPPSLPRFVHPCIHLELGPIIQVRVYIECRMCLFLILFLSKFTL